MIINLDSLYRIFVGSLELERIIHAGTGEVIWAFGPILRKGYLQPYQTSITPESVMYYPFVYSYVYAIGTSKVDKMGYSYPYAY